MNEITMADLSKRHNLVRISLLCSLVFFLIGLFALVSRWDSAVPIIVFACVFRLAAVWLARRKYNAAWMQASTTAAAKRKLGEVSYSSRETASQSIVTDLGFAPDVLLTPNTLRYHILKGELSGTPLEMAETAFIRVTGNRKAPGSQPVAGTLITAEGVLPPDDAWVLLLNHPLDSLCSMKEYDHSDWRPVRVSLSCTAAFAAGETARMEEAEKALGSVLPDRSAALAAKDGKLSLMLPGDYFARKADISKAPTESMLNSVTLPSLDAMQAILEAVHS